MAAVIVDPSRVHEFADAASFDAWLARHHASEAGRQRKIDSFVAMLKRGETIYPQRQK